MCLGGPAVRLGKCLHNGETQPTSACITAATLIQTRKPRKDLLPLFNRDASAVVVDAQVNLTPDCVEAHHHLRLGMSQRIFKEIAQNLTQSVGVSGHLASLAQPKFQAEAPFQGLDLKAVDHLACQMRQIGVTREVEQKLTLSGKEGWLNHG